MDLEEQSAICMEMISSAGEGRFFTQEALRKALAEDYQSASDLLLKAEEYLGEAHKIQFERLMAPQMSGVELPSSMLLSHAMDLLMISTSEHDILKIIVENYKDKT